MVTQLLAIALHAFVPVLIIARNDTIARGFERIAVSIGSGPRLSRVVYWTVKTWAVSASIVYIVVITVFVLF